MAYISNERVKLVREQIKPILKKYGISATVKRLHYSSVMLSVKSGGKLVNEFKTYEFERAFTEPLINTIPLEDQQQYYYYVERRNQIDAILDELYAGLKLPDWFDKSDIMTDYFHVDYYTRIKIIN